MDKKASMKYMRICTWIVLALSGLFLLGYVVARLLTRNPEYVYTEPMATNIISFGIVSPVAVWVGRGLIAFLHKEVSPRTRYYMVTVWIACSCIFLTIMSVLQVNNVLDIRKQDPVVYHAYLETDENGNYTFTDGEDISTITGIVNVDELFTHNGRKEVVIVYARRTKRMFGIFVTNEEDSSLQP